MVNSTIWGLVLLFAGIDLVGIGFAIWVEAREAREKARGTMYNSAMIYSDWMVIPQVVLWPAGAFCLLVGIITLLGGR